MNWDALGAIAEVCGALAVLASILYLAKQIKVTSMQLQSQLQDQIQTKIYEAYAPVYEGRNAEILYTGLNDPDALNEIDAFTFDLMMRRHMGAITTMLVKVETGELDELNKKAVIAHYQKVFFDKPGGYRWLQENGEELHEAKALFNDHAATR